MALLKSLTNEMGIVAKYHRIKYIDNDSPKLKVLIYSYADKSYRDEEKSVANVYEKIQAQMEIIEKICRDGDSSEESQLAIKEANEKLDELGKLADKSVKQFFIFQTEVVLNIEDEEEISFSNIYNELKKLDLFKGATDI